MTSSSGSYTPWDSQRERRDRKRQREHFNNNGRPLPKFDEKHKYNQEGQQLPGKKNLKKSTLRHIIIKLSKDKDRAAKTAEEKDPKLTSSNKNTKITTIYRTIIIEKDQSLTEEVP